LADAGVFPDPGFRRKDGSERDSKKPIQNIKS
jgi:hypothetical protein